MEKLLNEMKQLIVELNNASALYYNGFDSPLSDLEYDLKFNKLKDIEELSNIRYSNSPTQSVGSPVLSELNKIKIKDKPMLSLDKVHSPKDIINFAAGQDVIASVKCDGLSVRIIYKDGKLFSANTRGNGYEGADITEHIKHFLNVPLEISCKKNYIIDGEAIIYDEDFKKINKNNEFKNNRNTASGALSLLDMSIVKKRRISFIAWDVIKTNNEDCLENYSSYMEEAECFGFSIVPFVVLKELSETSIKTINDELLRTAKENGIPCDGIVWKINNILEGDKRGRTAHHWNNAIAYKFEDEAYETKLLDIEWSLGRTGILTPVAIFEPIEIDGSLVQRANLHNLSVLYNILGEKPKKYQKVFVAKKNQIIPQIIRAEKTDVLNESILNFYPSFCPICHQEIKEQKSESGVLNLICTNKLCKGNLLNRAEYFFSKKGLDVKGISKATIGKLIEWGWVNKIKDFYQLDKYRSEWISKPGFGKVSVNKILDALDESKNKVKLEKYISAIGIPLVGGTVAKQIVKYYPVWNEFRTAIGSDWTVFDGFGIEINNSINNFDYSEADEIVKEGFVTFVQEESQTEIVQTAAIKGKTFAITGKLSRKRDEIKREIESFGGRVTGSVSSKTDYLICNDKNSTTGKSADAKKLGVKIITEEEYINLKS